jgi:hypothetical protein
MKTIITSVVTVMITMSIYYLLCNRCDSSSYEKSDVKCHKQKACCEKSGDKKQCKKFHDADAYKGKSHHGGAHILELKLDRAAFDRLLTPSDKVLIA